MEETYRPVSPERRRVRDIVITRSLLVLSVLPFLYLVYYVHAFASELPVNDQWDECSFIISWKEGHPSFSTLFQYHNEHLLIIPRLCFAILAALFTWDNRVECWVTVLLTATTFCIIYKRVRTSSHDTLITLSALLGTSILLFSTTQWQNWLWGFQLGWPIPILALTAATPVVCSSQRMTTKLTLISAASLASLMSHGSGFLVPLILALLLVLRYFARRDSDAVYLIAASLTSAATGMILFIANRPSMNLYSSDTKAVFQGIVLLLVNPFLDFTRPSPKLLVPTVAHGSVIVIPLLAMTGWLAYRGITKKLNDSALYVTGLALILWASLNVGLIALARSGGGLEFLAQSRYIAYSSLLPVGSVLMALAVHAEAPARSGVRHVCQLWILAILGLALYPLRLESSRLRWGIGMRHVYQPLIEMVKVAPVFSYDTELGRIAPPVNRSDLIKGLAANRLFRGMIPPTQKLRPTQVIVNDQCGSIDSVRRSIDGGFDIDGWSTLSWVQRRADAVFLAAANPDGTVTLRTPILSRETARPNVGLSASSSNCGWHVHVPADWYDTDVVLVAFDWDKERFYRKSAVVRIK